MGNVGYILIANQLQNLDAKDRVSPKQTMTSQSGGKNDMGI